MPGAQKTGRVWHVRYREVVRSSVCLLGQVDAVHPVGLAVGGVADDGVAVDCALIAHAAEVERHLVAGDATDSLGGAMMPCRN